MQLQITTNILGNETFERISFNLAINVLSMWNKAF